MTEALDKSPIQPEVPKAEPALPKAASENIKTDTKTNKWKKIREQVSSNTDHASGDATTDIETVERNHNDRESLDANYAALEKANQALKQSLHYAQAELQNAARRHREGLEKTRQYAGTSTIEAFFPLLDSLEAASETAAGEHQTIAEKGTQNLLDLMYTIFRKLGVITIDPAMAEAFDPNLHSAVGVESVENSNQEANTITKVVRKGYRLHERVIRPAMVMISMSHES